MIKLDPTNLAPGAPLDYFAPSTWYQDNAGDQDLGSTTTLQLPNNRAFIVGKTGMGYLLNTASLGHIGGQLAAHQVCNATGDAAFGTLAYAAGVVFAGCSDGVAAVQIANGGNDFSPLWYNTSDVADHPPTVAGGLVWSVSSDGGHLLGFATASGQLMQTLSISGSTHFTTPSAANDMLYVGAGRFVDAFTGSPPVASRYHPLTPYRVLDTRAPSCVQCGAGALGPAAQRAVDVAGYTPSGFAGTIVPASATAVVLNVTAVNGSAATYLTAFPTGQGVPLASSVNSPASRIIANLVTVPVGTSGQVSVYNSAGAIDVLLDVEGYYDTTAGGGGTFHPLTPLRVCDTRAATGTACSSASDNPLRPAQTRLVSVWGHGGIPGDGTAAAAVLNLTAVSGTAPTYLSVYPPDASAHTCGSPPDTSNVNVPASTDEPNRVIVPIDATSGSICVFNSAGSINAIVDVDGWYGTGGESTLGAHFFAFAPTRICDTRGTQGTECAGQTLAPGATLTVQASGIDGIPPGAVQAVAANATAVSGTAATFVTLFPDGVALPATSDLNAPAGMDIANMAIVGLSSGGRLDAFNDVGHVDLVLDVSGWFA